MMVSLQLERNELGRTSHLRTRHDGMNVVKIPLRNEYVAVFTCTMHLASGERCYRQGAEASSSQA
jgi:hypothetical protein